MILLTSTSDLIQLVTGGTQVVHVQASFVDISGTTVTPTRLNSIVNTAATTSVVPSPATSTQRNVKHLSIRNTDPTNPAAITVQHTDGTNVVTLVSLSLLPKQTMTYTDGSGWTLTDQSGGRVETPLTGRFLGRTVLTAASGTFTTQTATNTLILRGVGGGGAGGGCTSVAAAASAAGGGGSGGYLEKTVAASPNTGYSFACGAAGLGASGAGGGNGGNSTFTVGATTFTAAGGGGAPVATAAAALTAYAGGAGAALSTNGDLNAGGEPGSPGVTLIVATPVVASGKGGTSAFGDGALGLVAAGAGNNATGFGGGGGGAATGASTVQTGGNGTGGCWVIEEYS